MENIFIFLQYDFEIKSLFILMYFQLLYECDIL